MFVELKVDSHSDETSAAIATALAGEPAVVAAHIVSGASDILLEAVVPDLPAYERLLFGTLLKLPHVVDARSNFTLRTIKPPGPLPL